MQRPFFPAFTMTDAPRRVQGQTRKGELQQTCIAPEGTFGQRIVDLAARLAAWSDTPDGLTCTYLTPAHRAVAAELQTWMREAGMSAEIDAVGNVVGRYRSTIRRRAR